MLEFFAWTVPLAPLVGCVCCAVFAIRGDRETAHVPAVLALAISALAAICLLVFYRPADQAVLLEGYRYLQVGGTAIDVSLRIDTLTLTLLTVVTTVSALVCVYSRDYMHGDPGYARYFAVFCGFVFAMTMLVLASNLLLLYAFWEGVGTCSYLLIGFWFRRPSAAAAATKAFLVNRLADTAFFLAILALGWGVGQTTYGAGLNVLQRYDFDVIYRAVGELNAAHPELLYWIGFGLIVGAIGKSAQFPLHVWLPDAMEGPTPVSALIHAATMVTAGVYLTARMSPLLTYVPDALVTVGYLGGITSILAAVMATFQDDLKRVLAYSTVSQLGYLFMALATASDRRLLAVAVWAAMFHLVTHAFFKALLFLSAGSVMHAMGDVIDMRHFSGLRRILPRTHWLFLIGAATLAGVPPLAAFFSKDSILSLLIDAGGDPERGTHFKTLAVLGFTTAFLTAIYTGRAYFRTFWGDLRLPPQAGNHPHDASTAMFVPMAALAVGSVLAGILLGPTGWLLHYIELTPLPAIGEFEHHESLLVMFFSALLAVIGVAIGYVWTGMRRDPSAVRRPSAIATFAQQRLYIDTLYAYLIVYPAEVLAAAAAWFDEVVVGGLSSAVGASPRGLGAAAKRLQGGRVPAYAMYSVVGVLALAVFLIAFN